jgi:hypothetical protein
VGLSDELKQNTNINYPTSKNKKKGRRSIHTSTSTSMNISKVNNSCGEISCLSSAAVTNCIYSSPLIKINSCINGRSAMLMIDSGSTSNFISSSFTKTNKIKTQVLNREYEQKVQLADGKEYVVKEIVELANLSWDGWKGKVTLLVLPLSHYDIILGMKWLKESNPKIDWVTGECYAADAYVEDYDKDKNINRNKLNTLSNLISPKRWRKEMKNGGEGGCILINSIVHKEQNGRATSTGTQMLLHNVNYFQSQLTMNNNNINYNNELNKILKEYNDVFPKDLPKGLPPDRGVQHRIELFPDATPPSRSAYKISPADSIELKKQ